MTKAFQIVLVTFVVIFTAVGLVLLASAFTSVLFPPFTSGIVAVAGGVSLRLIRLILIAALLLGIGFVYLLSRRKRVR